ncbi:putative cytochrome P450 [Xylariaceae sp. FL1019]|nr:putative cytochrome P450 [Xylariaceae sp. FL1019]
MISSITALSLSQLALISLVLCGGFAVAKIFYNVFLHPLRAIPGPLSHRMTILPRAFYHMNGNLSFHVTELHKRYGTVVRVAPNELAFSSPQAWRDIYGHKKNEFPKLPGRSLKVMPPSIQDAEAAEHHMIRRHVLPGFSERSMHEQEPIIGAYVDLLVSRLKDATKINSRQNIRDWYTWTTFDLIGDLSFGVDGGFGCLQGSSYHPWVKLINESFRQQGIVQGLISLGFRTPLTLLYKTASNLFATNKHLLIVKEKIKERMEGSERPDFLDGLISHREKLGLDEDRLAMNASVLIIAGSETTATVLSAVTYYLGTLPDVLKKVEQEVRSAFTSDSEITLTSVGNLPFMLACLDEALRCYPPLMNGGPRYTPDGGIIDGTVVPKNTVVTLYQYAINYSEKYWRNPQKFAPERWMNDPLYEDDNHDAMQPFGIGPRNCVGRNLAYAEMRLILAKVLYNFDISIADDSRNWLDGQKAYSVWVKPDLNVHLKPVSR